MADETYEYGFDPSEEDPKHLSGTAFFIPADLMLPVSMLLRSLFKVAGVREMDGFVCATESLDDGKMVMAELVKLQEQIGIEPLKDVIAFGRTIETFDLEYDKMTPGQTVLVATRTGEHRKTRVTFLPSVRSSWWEDEANISKAVITIKALFTSSRASGRDFQPFDLAPGLLELPSRFN